MIGVAALGASGFASAEPSTTVNLGDEGLEPGDDITPYLEEYWTSGTEVIIPGGSYGFSGDGDAFAIEAYEDSWLVGDGLVVLDTGYDFLPIEAHDGAHVRYENLEWDDELDARIRTWTTSTDSTVELVNVNIHGDPSTDEAGIYGAGDGENVGTLRFVNCTVDHFDDGLYMSSMFEGASEDGQAVVEVYGGLYRNCTSSNVRVGGHDSKVVSVASVSENVPDGIDNTKPLKIREAGENQVVRDCDFYVSDEGAVGDMILVTSDKFEGDRDTSVFVEDTRMYSDQDDDYVNVSLSDTQVEGDNLHLTGSLSSADTSETLEGSGPYTNVVTGSDAQMPTTEKRWVDPDSLEPVDDGGTGSTGDDTEDEESPSEHTLEINTFWDSGILYEFTVSGTVVGGEGAELEDNDSITDNGDGTMTVEGETGHGYADDYIFDGDVTTWSAETHPDDDSGEYELVLDGETVTPEELTGDSSTDEEEEDSTDEEEDSTDEEEDSTDDGDTSDSTPTIDRFNVTEAGSPNPHADITVDWGVADADGDLDSVLVQVIDSWGLVVDASKTRVSGKTAYDVDYFKLKHADGKSFDVRLTVTDAADNTSTKTATVTE